MAIMVLEACLQTSLEDTTPGNRLAQNGTGKAAGHDVSRIHP